MKAVAPPMALGAAILLSAAVAACSPKAVEAPMLAKVCFHVAFPKEGEVKFNKLAGNVPNLESCAAALEGMRLRFLRLGGAEEIVGAYQGQYLFLSSKGVQSAQTLTGVRYTALVPTGDGRLAVPGAMPASQ